MLWHSVDANHVEIVQDLKMIPNISVFDASDVGRGMTDLIIGYNKNTYLVELKVNKKSSFTRKQREFRKKWKGNYFVAYTLEDVLTAINYPEHIIRQICDYDAYPF